MDLLEPRLQRSRPRRARSTPARANRPAPGHGPARQAPPSPNQWNACAAVTRRARPVRHGQRLRPPLERLHARHDALEHRAHLRDRLDRDDPRPGGREQPRPLPGARRRRRRPSRPGPSPAALRDPRHRLRRHSSGRARSYSSAARANPVAASGSTGGSPLTRAAAGRPGARARRGARSRPPPARTRAAAAAPPRNDSSAARPSTTNDARRAPNAITSSGARTITRAELQLEDPGDHQHEPPCRRRWRWRARGCSPAIRLSLDRVTDETNYSSGDDYLVEFLGYRFSFNADDFEERVTAAAVKLGLIAGERARRRGDRRSRRARLAGLDRRAAQRARRLPRAPLGAALARRRRVARLLAAQARLPRRVARPPREGGSAGGGVGRGRAPSSRTATRAAAGRCSSSRPCRRGTSSSSAGETAPARRRDRGVPRDAARGRHAGRARRPAGARRAHVDRADRAADAVPAGAAGARPRRRRCSPPSAR